MKKFRKADLVYTDKRLAIVSSINRDGKHKIFFENLDEKWALPEQCELVAHDMEDLFDLWVEINNSDSEEEKIKLLNHSNLDWIFLNSKEVLNDTSVEVVNTLGRSLGIKLYGRRLDPLSWQLNEALPIIMMAKPYLENSDKQGWLDFCEKYRSSNIGKENAKVKIDRDYKGLHIIDYNNLNNRHFEAI